MPIPKIYIREDHRVYSLIFPLIFVVKYRQKVFQEGIGIVEDMKLKLVEIADNEKVKILEIECGIDHVHLLISASPNIEITKFINHLKGHSSRFIRAKYATFLQDKLWREHFWSGSYFIASTGNGSIDILKQYIERQRGRLAKDDQE
jgi:putative transposase